MQRRAILAETAGRRLICIGQSLHPENSRAMHRRRNETSRVTIHRLNTMSPAIIRLRLTMIRADHTRVQAQDRAAAVAVGTHRTAAAVAHIRVVAPEGDLRLTAAVLHPIAAAVEGMTHTRVPVRTVSGGAEYCPLIGVDKEKERRTTNRRSFCFSRMKRTLYQTPLSLPVILNATAAAEASGGSRLRRKVAGTFPLKAACVICLV